MKSIKEDACVEHEQSREALTTRLTLADQTPKHVQQDNMKPNSLVSHSLWLSALTTTGADASTPLIAKRCVELQVPVPVNAINHHYNNTPRFDSTIDAVQWAVNFTTWSTNTSNTGTLPVNRTFNINVQLCFPEQTDAKDSTLHIATHGLGFDKRFVLHPNLAGTAP